ncbi:PREDICTED: sarcospan-like isoform X1 [Branchiostoma belcheri]|uniref:Sarcospan-like isoform X1 n=2 Tax=Branchiostoma belcheri TaxID=7741 RepID=A0A6P4ZVJ3_BRABE|nr:PREDICTED: sarcospan-like isoform X1 [Branchiostoma belcheri]
MYFNDDQVTDRRPSDSDSVAMDNPAMEMEQSKNKPRTKRDPSPTNKQNRPGKDSGRPNGKSAAANGKTPQKNGSNGTRDRLTSSEQSERNGPKPGKGEEEPEMSPQKMQLRTTVPQSMTPKDLQSGPHSPRPRGSSRQKSPAATARKGCECCRLYFFLTIFQLLVGAGVIVLCVFISEIYSDMSRDVPYWSGIPLVIAALVGIYSCIFSRNKFESTWHFGVRIFFWILTFFCCIACVVAATFAGLHGTSIVDYVECLSLDSSCQCTKSFDSSARVFMYIDMTDCNLVFEKLKVLLFISCGVNAFGALVCFLILVMMWKRNYQRFYTGLGYTYASTA